jgi:hypothetical protein
MQKSTGLSPCANTREKYSDVKADGSAPSGALTRFRARSQVRLREWCGVWRYGGICMGGLGAAARCPLLCCWWYGVPAG